MAKKKRPRLRANIPTDIKDEILRRCRRHCCVCFGLRAVREVKDGQIAHLDRDRSNVKIENLAYLCLECHKVYDAQSNRVLSYTPGEIRHYRSQLYSALGHDQVEWTLTIRADRSRYESVKKKVEEAHKILRISTAAVSLTESPTE